MTIWCCAETTCFACGSTIAIPETHTYSISYPLLHIRLIPSDLVKCFVATVIKNEKLQTTYLITICCAKCVSEEDQKRTFFCYHAACATLQEDRRTFYFSNNSAVVQHMIFLNTWQSHLTLQHTQNALLLFHCNIGYANAPQCYVIHILSVLFLLYSSVKYISCSPYWSTWQCCWCSDFREIRNQSVVIDFKLGQFYL